MFESEGEKNVEKNLKKKNHSQNITQQRGFELQFTASTQLQDPTLIQLRHYPVLAVDELKSRVNIGPQQQQQRRLFFFFRRGELSMTYFDTSSMSKGASLPLHGLRLQLRAHVAAALSFVERRDCINGALPKMPQHGRDVRSGLKRGKTGNRSPG